MISTDAVYCNERSSDYYTSKQTEKMFYASYHRLLRTSGKQPSYKCGEVTGTKMDINGNWINAAIGSMYNDASSVDKFSKSTGSGGNGQLKYPVGLMTAAEIVFAGGKYYTEDAEAPKTYSYYYINNIGESVTGNKSWWTISPATFISNGIFGTSSVFLVHGDNGALSFSGVSTPFTVRPVNSLKPNVIVSSGNGTAEYPYEMMM